MIVLFFFLFCGLYFVYLNKWAQSFLSKEYHFGSPSPPKPLPHSPNMSIVVGALWSIFLLGGVFWGFTFNRYPDHLSLHGVNAEVLLLIVLCLAVGLSYGVVYRLGEINGVKNMKNTQLFQNSVQRGEQKQAHDS